MTIYKAWNDNSIYKAPVRNERLYFKRVTEGSVTPWVQPLLTSNDSATFRVWGDAGSDTWRAFATASGYTSGYSITKYGNEYSTTLYTYMQTTSPTVITGISLYVPTLNSDMNWGSIASTRFYGSNDNATWTELYSTGNIAQDTQLTFNFSNSTKYNYYQYQMTTYGSGHKDRSALCSFRLIGNVDTTVTKIVRGTEDDYDFYEDTDVVEGFRFY